MKKWKNRSKKIICTILTLAMCVGGMYLVPIVKAEENTTTVLDSIEQEASGKLVELTEGYAEDDKYVILSATLKSMDTIRYDWSKTVCIGVSGTETWSNYAFQFAYGKSSAQNLIKLNGTANAPIGGGNYDNISVGYEQWYNNEKMEQLFADEGMDIKLIRFSTWVYLLSDMGEGYELIGKLVVPEDAPTQFTLSNKNTTVRMSKIVIETGKAHVVDALAGIDLNLNSKSHYFPVDSNTWTLEGKLALDKNTIEALTGDYRVYVGNKPIWNGTGAAVLCVGDTNLWRGQELATWKSKGIPAAYVNLLNEANGGLWVRWVRQDNVLSLWASADHEKWYPLTQDAGLTNSDLGVYLQSTGTYNATLTDIRMSLESESPSVLEQEVTSGDILTIPGDYASEKYAVLEATITAPDGYTKAWDNNVILSSTGTAKWDGYDMQILFGDNVSKNCVKTDKVQAAYDGITITQTQWVNRSEFMNLFSTGLKIKLVRLNTWTYLLADMGSGYELVGKIHTPENQATSFGIYNSKTRLLISDWNVKTGKENTLTAMDGMKLDLTTNAYSFPVNSENWTLEGRITYVQSTFDSLRNGENYHVLAGTNLSNAYMSACWLAGKTEGNWNNWGVTALRGMTDSNIYFIDHWMRDNNTASGGGMWTRWVKDGDTLSIYASPDRVTWKSLELSSKIDAGVTGIYLKESVDIDSRISNITIRTSTGEATYKDMGSDSIAATAPSKTTYHVGETLDTNGMQIVLKDGNEVVRQLALSDCTISPKGKLTTQDTKITISYRNFSVEVPITVNTNNITQVELKDTPYKTEYQIGEPFTAAGATYVATYENGELVEYDIETSMCNAVDTTTSGSKVVTATVPYANTSAEMNFEVKVKAEPVKYEPTIDVTPQPEEDEDDEIVAEGWDLTKLDEGIAKSLTDSGFTYAWLTKDAQDEICITANIQLPSAENKDTRAGFYFKNENGDDVFVALSMNGEAKGKAFYSIQLISNGYSSWKKSGTITDISTWNSIKEAANSDKGVPMTVYVEDGQFTIGINGYLVAENVYASDADGNNVFGDDTELLVGLATSKAATSFTNLEIGTEEPVLKDAEQYKDTGKVSPTTGDSSSVIFYMGITVVALACIVFVYKKKNSISKE